MKKVYILFVLVACVCLCLTGCSPTCSVCGEDESFLIHHQCPECSVCFVLSPFRAEPSYCAHCGYEFIHRCECGRICDTPFCKVCGAEQ